ncbi:MAG: VWA domain-containing protein, partial [Deltaproteobacteria bacterium]|nr:VWA domain-containing protein [Deltaproteobacteria bacterium]
VTARAGHPYVKLFREERELTVMFLVDLSASGAFGSTGLIKNEAAAEICALLAFSAIKNNDKVGLIVFTDQIEMFIPPQKGTTHVLRLIRELLSFRPGKRKTDLTAGMEYLGRVLHKKSVVFLVSDFQGEGYEKQLRILGKRHDLIALSITDPREVSMPDVGLIELEDAETGEMVIIDTGSASFRKGYEQMGLSRLEGLKKLFRSMDIVHIDIRTGQDYVRDLVKFFRNRGQRR